MPADRTTSDKRSSAVDEGMEAFVAGMVRGDNPYGLGHELREYWDRGWLIGAEISNAA